MIEKIKTTHSMLQSEIRSAAKLESGGLRPVRLIEKKPLRREIRDPDPYPLEALGSRLSPVVRAIEEITQAPLEACAQLVVGVANAAVQGLADVALPHGVRPVSLFMLCILPSGERKSAVFSVSMKGIQRFETHLQEEYAAAQQLLKHGHDIELPPLPIVSVQECTIDGLIKLLSESRGTLVIASDEAGVFANGYGMAQKDLMRTCALFSSLWDASPIKMARAAVGHRMVYGARVAMALMAQHAAVASLLSNDLARAQGLLGRFLMTMPLSRVGDRPYRQPSQEALDTVAAFHNRVFDTLMMPLPLVKNTVNVLEPRHIPLTPQAVSEFAAFHDEVEAQLAEGARYFPIREFACKAAEHAVRLAATLALFHNRSAERVTAIRMRDGVTLARYYLEEHLRIVVAEGDPDLILAEKLLKWIRKHELEVVPLTRIYRHGPPEIRQVAKTRHITKILVDHGYLGVIEGGVVIEDKVCDAFQVL